MRLMPLLVLLALILFPFGWLGELWPAFGRELDQLFSTDGWHAIGHATLFSLLGLAALVVLPQLTHKAQCATWACCCWWEWARSSSSCSTKAGCCCSTMAAIC